MSRGNTMRSGGGLAIAASLAMSVMAAASLAAEKVQPEKVEAVAGSDVKRVILTAKTAERLGIQTAPLREQKVVTRMVVSGEVVEQPIDQPPASVPGSGSGDLPAAVPQPAPSSQRDISQNPLDNPLRVRILLDQGDNGEDDIGNYDDEDDAEILAPDTDEDDDDAPLRADRMRIVSADPATSDILYFKVKAGTHSLKPGQYVGVRMARPGSGAPRKVVPYSAVIYDVQGDAWVYTNPEPLVFVRTPIAIDYIDQEMAVLTDGPELGTQIVTVGAAELFGAEAGH